jgi:hypothetical protein
MRGSIIWGGVLIVLGGLFLLDNLGLLPVRAWELFWPLLLIGLGVWTVIGLRRRNTKREVSVAEVPLRGAARARVRVQHGAGVLRVHAGAIPGMLASGSFAGGLAPDAHLEGDLLVANLRPDAEDVRLLAPWNWGPGGAYDWDLALADTIPLELTIETGASESHLELSGLRVSSLSVKTGASSTSLTMPAHPAGTCPVRIEGGAASIEANVPAGTEAFIRTESGLAECHVDQARFLPVPGGHQSAGYPASSDRLEIKVSMGLGAFRLS